MTVNVLKFNCYFYKKKKYEKNLFPTNIYIGEISQETHDATLAKLSDIEWGTVPLSNKAHSMNISKKEGKPSFQADVMSEYEID